MSLSGRVVPGLVPGPERRPEKRPGADEAGLLSPVHRWRDESERRGRRIGRICVAFESGRDGFWLARWLEGRGIEAHVIHAGSFPVKREQRRAKTDRLDCRLLMRAFVLHR
jgi:transposase